MQYKLTGEGAIEITPMSAMKLPPHSQQRPRIAIALQSQQDLREMCPYIAMGFGGKETKQVNSEI